MTPFCKFALIILLAECSAQTTDYKKCYWRGFPWCGLVMRCPDEDYFVRYGTSLQCILTFDKYCCPMYEPDGDFFYCEERNLKGLCFVQTIRTGRCTNLFAVDKMSSVNPRGQCLRLFEKYDCEGKSVDLPPASLAHNDLNEINVANRVKSVSACFSIDKRTRRKRSNNNRRFSNDFTIGHLSWLTRDSGDLHDSPVDYYQIGPNDRTEAMEAVIQRNHLDTGTPSTNAEARRFVQTMGYSGDQAGHLLSSRLGGSGTDLRNIFPQNSRTSVVLWRTVEELVYNTVLRSITEVRFSVNLLYETKNSTRPHTIVYRIKTDSYDWIIDNIPNP